MKRNLVALVLLAAAMVLSAKLVLGATTTASITPQVFWLCWFLTVAWGNYLRNTINDWRVGPHVVTKRGERVAAFRRMVVAFCVWSLPLSFLVRTGLVLAGLGQETISTVLFFALAGPNVVGSIFVNVSYLFDD